MATSNCLRCQKETFELVLAEPKGAAVRMYFVQCASCGGVVGTAPFADTASMLIQQNEALKEIARHFKISVKL